MVKSILRLIKSADLNFKSKFCRMVVYQEFFVVLCGKYGFICGKSFLMKRLVLRNA